MRYIVNNDMPYFRVLYKAYIIEEVGVGGWKMFTWNRNTQIKTQIDTAPVRNAVDILYRDMEKTLKPVSQWCGDILLEEDNSLGEEQYRIEVETSQITIYAQDDLGWVYGLLLLSERFLGVKPFWFWMDQTFEQKESIEVVEQTIYSPKPVIRFRGWFFNDEVLMLKWKYNENGIDGWKMALEALLRCGGNMAIPGTDKMSRKNRQLAADMGLWITHHHAEPLGAEMFVRAYPDEKPNYLEHPELFHKLWEDAVIAQKDCKVVWNLCFRGQGDMPFWSTDTTGRFDTPAKRGQMISEVIRKQCDIVRKYVKNPVFCTNLYGEIMELYEQGYIELDTDVIKVRADNGYGRMVTRRRDNHSARVSSMPDGKESGPQGIYYHVSFYDLQAANHITMLPNSVDFVEEELSQVMANGGNDFWVINCSNVRPHVYYLDAIRKIWFGEKVSDVSHSRQFVDTYYHSNQSIAACYREYPQVMSSYGKEPDEHAGEQLYTENIRLLAHQFLVDRTHNVQGMYWLVGDVPYGEQLDKLSVICEKALPGLEALLEKCEKIEDRLFDATLKLQVQIHAYCCQGVILYRKGYEAFCQGDFEKSFVLFGDSAVSFEQADKSMRQAEYGVWQDFYYNDCFADVKHTAYMVRKVMGLVREFGDNARHDKWYRDYCYAKEDRDVFLLLVLDNHMTDEELYRVMKEKISTSFYI